MGYVQSPLRTSWRVTMTAIAPKCKAPMLTWFSSAPKQSARRAGAWIPARFISIASSKPRTSYNRGQSRLYLPLALSTSLAVGMFLSGSYEGSSWMDLANIRPNIAANLTPASNSQTVTQPTDFAETSVSVEASGPTSTQHSISLVPVHPGQTRQSHLEAYETLEEEGEPLDVSKLPTEDAILTKAPHVPAPIKRVYPALVRVNLTTMTKVTQLTSPYKYEQWTFNDMVPGPFIRARAGDVIDLTLTNRDQTGNPHNIDSHAFIGPGGGAALTTVGENETKTARFRLLYPGLYIYHCAAAPVPVHIANGMYGLIYVQPAEGDLPEVDREYYVMQSEFYHEPPEILEDGRRSPLVEFSYPNALREEPNVVVFNGSESALTRDQPLKAAVNETVRIYFGNAGPNLTSAFHVIGSNFKSVYRDGDVVNPPANFVSTVSVPPGAATITDMKMVVPGTYTLVDHAIFRLDKGAVGYLNVSGEPRPDIYQSTEPPRPCVGCKLHA